MEDDTRRVGLIRGLRTGLSVRISIALARHFLKHAIDCADVEVNMLVQAGAKAVDEGDCADVQSCLVWVLRAGAVGLQRLRDDPQEDTQHHAQHRAVALHKVAQPLWHRQHPLAHRQAGEDVVGEVRCRLCHAPRGA